MFEIRWFKTVTPFLLLVAGLAQSPLQAENRATNGSFEIRKSGEPNSYIDTLTPDREDLVGWRVTGRSIDWVGPTRWKATHGEHCLDLDTIGFIQVCAYPLPAYFDDDN